MSDPLMEALCQHADRLLDALRREQQPFPEMFGSPLPSVREIDAELARKYDAPKPPRSAHRRGGAAA